jgi:hypothetical protein
MMFSLHSHSARIVSDTSILVAWCTVAPRATTWQAIRRITHLSTAILLAGTLGCATLDTSRAITLLKPTPKAKVPTSMTALWTHTVLNQPGKTGVRGFGGRIMFLGKNRDKPLFVDGTLSIYAYDDTQQDSGHSAPQRKYVFTADQLPSHYSKSSLGHSYSVWIPWDEVGGPQRTIGLIARFEGRKGGVVMSEMSRQVLPGVVAAETKSNESEAAPGAASASSSELKAPPDAGGVQQVGHVAPQSEAAMTTTTIAIPPSFARKALRGASADPIELQRLETIQRLAERLESDARAKEVSSTPKAVGEEAISTAERPAEEVESPERSTRSAPPRFPARATPRGQPRFDPVRRRPHPAGWPSGLPPTPRGAEATVSRETGTVGEPVNQLEPLPAAP